MLTRHVQDSACAVDEMGGRLDELEKSISDLVQQAGVEGSPAQSKPAEGMPAAQLKGS
jgi:Heat shock factor binding protein 1